MIPATGLRKVGTGEQRAEKTRNVDKIQLGEHLHLIRGHQVYNMITYKRDVLERQSLSEVKMA